MQSLLHDLAAAYSGLQPHVSFDFSAVGSTAGLEELRRGNADLALVARRLQPEEESEAESRKRLLSYTVIAHDGIAVIVNASNPVGGLTLYDIRNIFEGRVARWELVGGVREDIVVVSREEGSGTRSVFEELVMYGRRTTPTGLIMPGSKAVRNYVATHPEAIGYLSMGLLDSSVAAVAVDQVQPKRGTVEDGTYWISRPFLLVSHPEPNLEVAGFMQFARSPAGQVIVRSLYGDARAGG